MLAEVGQQAYVIVNGMRRHVGGDVGAMLFYKHEQRNNSKQEPLVIKMSFIVYGWPCFTC